MFHLYISEAPMVRSRRAAKGVGGLLQLRPGPQRPREPDSVWEAEGEDDEPGV